MLFARNYQKFLKSKIFNSKNSIRIASTLTKTKTNKVPIKSDSLATKWKGLLSKNIANVTANDD